MCNFPITEGWLAVFDGDYETISISNHPHDPIGACVESFKESFPQSFEAGGRIKLIDLRARSEALALSEEDGVNDSFSIALISDQFCVSTRMFSFLDYFYLCFQHKTPEIQG